MAQLPTPGGDDGTWGNILNDYLLVSHKPDGTLQVSAVQSAGSVMSVNTLTPNGSGNVTLTAANVGAVSTNKVGAASGVASLNNNALVPTAQLATGTADATTYLRGDGTWTSPNSGTNQQIVATKTSSYSLTVSDEVILANASGGNMTITLPAAAGNQNLYVVKKIDGSGNTVTLATTGGQTIDGGSTAALKVQYASISVVSDGSNWYII